MQSQAKEAWGLEAGKGSAVSPLDFRLTTPRLWKDRTEICS